MPATKRIIPPEVHPENVTIVDPEFHDDPAVSVVRGVLARARAEVGRFHGIVEKIEDDPTPTPDQRLVLAALAGDRTLKPLLSGFTDAERRLNAARDRANQAIDETLAPGRGPGAYPGEVRSTIRSLSSEERQRVLGDAIENGNARIVGAVLAASGEPFMTGLSPSEIDLLRARWIQTQAPREAGTLEAIEKVRGVLHRGGEALLSIYAGVHAAAKDAVEKQNARKEALEG